MSLSSFLSIIFVNLRYFLLKISGQKHKIIPYKVLVELTNKCNSKCLTCDIWKIKQSEWISLDIDKFKIFTKEMGLHLKWLAFSGGEISLVSNFDEFVKVLKVYSTGLKIVTFTTNGLNPDRILNYTLQLKRELKSTVFITISLDGDEIVHDNIRGVEGNYKKAVRTFELLKNAGIWCHFGLTVSEQNADFIINNAKVILKETRAITISHDGGLFLNNNFVNQPSDEKIKQALKTLNKHYRVQSIGEVLVKIYLKLGIRFLEAKRSKNIIQCDVGNSSIHIHGDGSISPCMYLEAFTTINNGFSIEDFSNSKAMELKKRAKKGDCPNCWMNCYAPHSIMQAPVKSILKYFS